MNKIAFEKPRHIDDVRKQFDITKLSVITTPNDYPTIKGIEYEGNIDDVLVKAKIEKKYFPIKRKMDERLTEYENAMLVEWNKAKRELTDLRNKVKALKKMDYNNVLAVNRIAKIPPKSKKEFVEIADKYDLNLSILDKIVLNPSLMVNARYDSRKNLMEFNPDYLKQHGQIRIGDSGEWISETAKTFIHEFGHAYWYLSLTEEDRRKWQSLSTFLTRDQLTGNMEQYLVGEKKRFDGSTMYSSYYTLRDEPFVSVYARFNFREDFAESFLYYKVAPKTLERICPAKFEFMEEKVGNKIEKETIEKQFAPDISNPRAVRDKIISILDNLKDRLSKTAKEHYPKTYDLGREKGRFYTGEVAKALGTIDEENLQRLLEENDGYLDDFMDDVSDDYDDVLFVLTPVGMIEGIKPYDDTEAFDEEFDNVIDSQEHRLSTFATAGLSMALAYGLIEATDEFFTGGMWHCNLDGKQCDECGDLEGKWMTYEEFLDIYGNTECDGNCRCGDLFEPAIA